MLPEREHEIRMRAEQADHAWPSNHAHYMPKPCDEILTGWLYPLAEGTLELLAELASVRGELDEAREALRKYGSHRADCVRYQHDYKLQFRNSEPVCLCGYSYALSSSAPAGEGGNTE